MIRQAPGSKGQVPGCCTRPALRRAWVPCWPFEAAWCENCGDVMSLWGWFRNLLWTLFVWPVWNGTIRVEKSKGGGGA